MSFLAAFRKEILELWRTHRFLVVVAVLLIFGLLSPVLAKFTPEIIKMIPGAEDYAFLIPVPTVADAVDQYVKNISQFVLLLAVLITMGAVSQEKDKGTAAMVLSKPLSRGAFLAAKLASLLVLFTAGLLLAGLGAYYYTYYLFEALPVAAWLGLNGMLLVYTLVYVAMTLFFSTLSRSQVTAGGFSLGAVILLAVLGSLPRISEYVPRQLVNWGTALLQQDGQTWWPALWISLGLILASLLGAWLVLRRQEI